MLITKDELEEMWDKIFVTHSTVLFSLTCLKGIEKNTKLKALGDANYQSTQTTSKAWVFNVACI
jgi:hypothetical protein